MRTKTSVKSGSALQLKPDMRNVNPKSQIIYNGTKRLGNLFAPILSKNLQVVLNVDFRNLFN